MPSPFPGMDPYLEAKHLWPDFHNALAGEIRVALNRSLPTPYYAQMELRAELGIIEDEPPRTPIRPDLGVVERHFEGGGIAVAEAVQTEVSPSIDVLVYPEPYHLASIEVRDAASAHRLVTLIEILSPSNKRPTLDRDEYEAKQRRMLGRQANLVEIDLLRDGDRVYPTLDLKRIVEGLSPRPDYLATVNRYWRRVGGVMGVQLFPIVLREPLPCIAVPLKEGERDVPLDLQHAFRHAYDGGPYLRGAVDYALTPEPPLDEPDAAWALARLRESGLVAS